MRPTITGLRRMRTTSKIDLLLVGFVLLFTACADEEPIDWPTYCQLEDDECPKGCAEVRSRRTWSASRPCAKDDVLFGCMPDGNSEYWSTHGYFDIGGYCDRLVADPQYYVCFQGWSTWWAMGHPEFFCLNNDCPPQTLVCDPPPDAR